MGGSQIRPLVELAIWLALVIGMWIYSYTFDRELRSYAFSPVAWPRAVLAFIAFSAVLAWAAERKQSQTVDDRAVANTDCLPLSPSKIGSAARLLGALSLPLAYVWLLPRAGYFAVTPFFLAAYMWLLGLANWRLIGGLSLAIYAVMLILFSKLLYVPLPTGNWPGFYDFSNWVLVRLGNGW
jgi:hypothetical protein